VTPSYYFGNREAGNMGSESRESFGFQRIQGAGGELQMKAPAHFLWTDISNRCKLEKLSGMFNVGRSLSLCKNNPLRPWRASCLHSVLHFSATKAYNSPNGPLSQQCNQLILSVVLACYHLASSICVVRHSISLSFLSTGVTIVIVGLQYLHPIHRSVLSEPTIATLMETFWPVTSKSSSVVRIVIDIVLFTRCDPTTALQVINEWHPCLVFSFCILQLLSHERQSRVSCSSSFQFTFYFV